MMKSSEEPQYSLVFQVAWKGTTLTKVEDVAPQWQTHPNFTINI